MMGGLPSLLGLFAKLPGGARAAEWLARSPLLRRVAGAMFWNLFAAGLPRIVPLFVFMALARILGKETFGALGAIQNTVVMLGTLAGFGLGVTATAGAARYRRSDPEKTGRILGLTVTIALIFSTVLSGLLALLAPYLAGTWLHSAALAQPLRISAALLALNTLNGVQLAILAGLESFKESAIASLWSSALSFLWLPCAFLGLEGAIIALIGSGLMSCIACQVFVRRVTARAGIRINYASCWAERGIMGSYALPAALGNMLYAPVFWFCTTLLLKMPHGYADMGEFSAANQWRSLVIFVPAVLGQAVIPIVADCVAQGRGREAMKMLRDLTITLAYVCVPVFVLLSASSPIIMWAYGPSFESAWPTFCILQAVVLVQIVESPVIRYMDAVGDLWLAFLFNCALAVAMVASASLLVYLGAAGLAWAILIAFVSRSSCLCIYAFTRMRKRAEDVARSAADVPGGAADQMWTLDGLLRASSPSADKPHSM